MKMNTTALLATTAPIAFDNGIYPTPEEIAELRNNRPGGILNSDPMLKRSKDCARMLPYWDLADALIIGIEAVRAAGTAFLPRFADEDEAEYAMRLKLTKMTNVYSDIVEGLASKPFEQETKLVDDESKAPPDNVLELCEDIDGSGNNLTVFAAQTFFNGMNNAIDWIFVDHAPTDPTIRNRAEAKAVGLRPYWSRVLGRNVIDVQSKVINGNETLTYMKIYEPGDVDHVREFERLETGVVIWRLYEKRDVAVAYKDGGETKFHLVEEGTITIGVIPLVPFITGRRDGRGWYFYPPMRAAADLQKELYQQESGLKYAKTMTAYAMLAANGIEPPLMPDGKTVKKVKAGPGRILYSKADRTTGKVGEWKYLEPSASSLKFLAEDIKDTIKELRELGRQPLTAQSGNLTVITTSVAANKAKSAVTAWALGLKDALENAFVMTMLYMGIKPETYDPTVSVFVEFDEFTEGKDLETLTSARAAKDMSQETYWEELRRRGVLSAEFDPDVERKRLLKELPGDGDDTDDDDTPPPDDPDKQPGIVA